MTETDLSALLGTIAPPDEAAMAAARRRQDSLAKPPRSLGVLEEISVQLAGVTGNVINTVDRRRIAIFSSDNGVCAEGVASAPQSVTRAQTINFTRHKTGVSAMAKYMGIELDVIDVGNLTELPYALGIRNEKIAAGTKNIAKGPAMTREECLRAIGVGIDAARRAKADGVEVLGVGEMGIGNTSTSSAVLCALTGIAPDDAVGRGGCITDAMLAHKRDVVKAALTVNRPDRNDPVGVLAAVGGFDLAAMAGTFLGAASERLPVVIDGYISAVAALAAYRLCPTVRGYLFPSHKSSEAGYTLAMEEMGMRPYLDLGMRLGEGSGCPLAFSVMQTACIVMAHMATFDEAEINDDYLTEVRQEMEIPT